MSSEKQGMSQQRQIHCQLNAHPPQMVFPEAFVYGPQLPHRRSAATSDPGPKPHTPEQLIAASLFQGHQYFQPPQPQASQFDQRWNAASRSSADDSEQDDGEDENDEEEPDEEDIDTNLDNIVTVAKITDRDQDERYGVSNHCRDMKYGFPLGIKDGNMARSAFENVDGNNRNGEMRNTSSSELYYSGYANRAGVDGPGSSSGQRELAVVDNSCGFSGRKDASYQSESLALRTILSDPLTGSLMEDAMILPCGHSFSSSGIHQIVRMKACYTCSLPVSEDSISPNLSLRQAVQAFKREEEFQVNHASKRRRERYEQDKCGFGDSMTMDQQRGKRIQFPFSVTDRVIIKGNKRTPERFFGREAIVTAQCLNGWYVVKTLDTAESVKLQYRSLAKVVESTTPTPSTVKTTPNWL